MLTNIALDTNIWIYLTKDSFAELFEKIKKMQAEQEIQILTNDLIILEWNRNKVKTINTLVENIKSEYRSAKALASHMDVADQTSYLETISNFSTEESRIQKARHRVEEIEKFIFEKCKRIPITTEQKLFVAELAIKKAPPFENNKNNFNDALIVRSLAEYVKSSYYVLHDVIYVSNNPGDYINKVTGKPYNELIAGIEGVNFVSVTELGEALKLAPDLIDELDEWLENQLDNQAMTELDIMRGK